MTENRKLSSALKMKERLNYVSNTMNSLNEKIYVPKPILKWAGGKTQIMGNLIVNFPAEINNYREVFLGGGSVLLTLLSYVKNGAIKVHGNIYASDLNEALIYTYKNIQSQPNELYDVLQCIITNFNECTEATRENYYYRMRSEYNLSDNKDVLSSAMFIFLNKTCFRGLFRVGPNGFNVPYGHYVRPEIINKKHLEEVHRLIQGVIFECCDFSQSLKVSEPEDFVYLDPPYAPETITSFVGYTKSGFTIDHHNNLFQLIHTLTNAGRKIMLSNADVKFVRENFTRVEYNITSILCKRTINSKNPSAKAKEVIIRNY